MHIGYFHFYAVSVKFQFAEILFPVFPENRIQDSGLFVCVYGVDTVAVGVYQFQRPAFPVVDGDSGEVGNSVSSGKYVIDIVQPVGLSVENAVDSSPGGVDSVEKENVVRVVLGHVAGVQAVRIGRVAACADMPQAVASYGIYVEYASVHVECEFPFIR